jgi:hypothetical protein
VNYINSQLAAGFDVNKIRNDLMANGSLPSEIDLAFSSLNGAPAVSPQNPIPVAQNASMSTQNIPNPVIPPYTPMNQAPVFTEQPAGGSILKKILITVVVLIVVGGISAGAYFGYPYLIGSKVTLSGAVINTMEAIQAGKIQSGKFLVNIEAIANDVAKNYGGLAPSEASKQMISQFQDVAFKFAFSGTINKTTDGNYETEGDLSASVKNPTGGSLGMFGPQEFAAKYKVFSDNTYVNVQSLPSITAMMIPPTINVSKYLNQWFSAPTDMTKQYSEGYTSDISSTTISTEVKNKIIDFIDNSGVITVIDTKSEKTTGGTAVTAMHLKLDLDKLGDELIKQGKADAAKNGFTYQNSSELEIRANIEKMKEISVINEVIKVLVGNDGYIHGYVVSGDSMDKVNNKIGSFKLDFSVDNFNESFQIDRPADARDIQEVMMEINTLMNQPTKIK